MPKPKVTFLDQESAFRGQYSKNVFQTLYFAYRAIFGRLGFFMICGFVGRLLLLSNANLIGVWVDSFCHAPAVCKPLPSSLAMFSGQQFMILLVGVTALGFLLTALYRVGFSRSSAKAISYFYDEVTIRTSRLPIRFFDQNPVGRVVTRFSSDYGNIFRIFGGPLAELLAIVFDIVAMFVLIAFAGVYYLPIFFAIAVLNYFVYRANVQRMRLARRDLSASRSPSIAHFAETTQGASTIRSFARQGTFFRRFRELNDRYLGERVRTMEVASLFSLQMSASTSCLLLVTGAAGYYLSHTGRVSIGSIGVAFTFIVLSGTSLQMFFEWMAQFEEAMTGVERLDDYLRRELEPGAKLPAGRLYPTSHPVYAVNEEAQARLEKLTHNRAASINFENVQLRYGADLPVVLKSLNFTIRPGERVGIVGRTGSGKTSLVQALFYLYPLEQGRILIDGCMPRLNSNISSAAAGMEVDLTVYRRSIALISQEPTLFRGTLRENLDLTNSHDEQELLDALTRVGLRDWFQHQTLGFALMIEERGRNLSVGERQLLCMARCLLQDAPVVVMDEATSSVDPQSEEIMVRATREFFRDRTQLIIAHRLSTIEDCDRVLWLQNGEVRMFDKPSIVLPTFKETRLLERAVEL